MNRPLHRGRRRHAPALVAVATLLATATFSATPAVAQTGTPQQGVQFGHLIDLEGNSCGRTWSIGRFLSPDDDGVALRSATSWIRMDFRGAGGVGSSVTCDVAGAYGGILTDIGSGTSVIGLLGNDLLWGTANAFDWTEGTSDAAYAEYVEAYATAAAAVICSSTYAQVDVWEVWNEPNYTQFKLSPARYAKLLHRTVDKMNQTCSRTIISGGVNGYVDPVIGGPVEYLSAVDDTLAAEGTHLGTLVNGIGVHPYVQELSGGSGPLTSFINAFSGFADPLYVTEIGWHTWEYPETVTCPSLVQAFGTFHADYPTRVKAATFYALQDSDGTWGLYDTSAAKRLSFWGYTTGACEDPCPSSIANSLAGGTCPLPPPPAPSSPTATPLSGTSVQIGWLDNSTTETGFEISNGTTTRSVGVNVTGYTWTGLAQGSTTCFKIRAVNSAGASAWTPNACATTPTIPAAPTNQAAIVLSGTTIRLTWADRSTNETGFEVTNGVTTVDVAPNSTGYSWGGLAMGTYMCLAVRAVNLAGKSAQTPWACDTTPTLPAAPTGQTATPASGTSMKVTWTDRSTNETGFQITNGVTTAMVPPNTTSYTWTGLTMGSYTCFAIKAVNLAGSSPQTPWACNYTPRIPTPPSGPYATPVNLSSIKINWVDMSTNETSFEINNGTTTKTVGANVTSYTWTGLASHTSMCFRVRAVNLAGASVWTIYACATTL